VTTRATGRAAFKGLRLVLKGMLAVAAAAGALALKAAIFVVKGIIAAAEKALKAALRALRELFAKHKRARALARAAARVKSGRRTRRFRLRWRPSPRTTKRLEELKARLAAAEAARARRAAKTKDRTATPESKAVPKPPAGRPVPFPRPTRTPGASTVAEPVFTNYFAETREALQASFQRMMTEFGQMFDEERFDLDWRHVEASGREMNALLEEFAHYVRQHGQMFEDKPAITGAFGETVVELGTHLDSTAEAMDGAINAVRAAHSAEVEHVEERKAGRQVFNAAREN
jgi:hypothetical protein